VRGECRGAITADVTGSAGFGYDPIFLVPELGKTLAELPAVEKNAVSHRGNAARAARPVLLDLLREACPS
jgi:XTP/dITP diphosphohydrolase